MARGPGLRIGAFCYLVYIHGMADDLPLEAYWEDLRVHKAPNPQATQDIGELIKRINRVIFGLSQDPDAELAVSIGFTIEGPNNWLWRAFITPRRGMMLKEFASLDINTALYHDSLEDALEWLFDGVSDVLKKHVAETTKTTQRAKSELSNHQTHLEHLSVLGEFLGTYDHPGPKKTLEEKEEEPEDEDYHEDYSDLLADDI